LRAIFRRPPQLARLSITFDNGSEFARHQNLSQTLDMKTWFCDPHSPWQHGSIENANGVLRRDLPKKSDLAHYSQQDIHDIV
jgi:IS30 family transposase